jgi:hypothetical protein
MPMVRFIPGPDQGDAEIVVLGVELHQELVVIEIATTMISPVQREMPRHKLPSVRVEDDLGTSYRGKGLAHYGWGTSGNAPAAHFPMEFGPRWRPEHDTCGSPSARCTATTARLS